MECRNCNYPLRHEFVDLVSSPPSNSFLSEKQLDEPETYYPLKLFVCEKCFLVQIAEYKKFSEIFDSKYVYFSSFSATWLEHCKKYAQAMVSRFALNGQSLIVEVASNDGYLLQYFLEQGIPVLGIEPTANTAQIARERGIETVVRFFDREFAAELKSAGREANLLAGNNVLAHVPDINSFVEGMKILLAPKGVITMEFPHLLQMITQNQFDTIYHEHFSYLSVFTVKAIFEKFGLQLFDVEELSTHGGSLRIYAKHESDSSKAVEPSVESLLAREKSVGIDDLKFYQDFQRRAEHIRDTLLELLLKARRDGKSVAAYGAAAKGNTLLNYCGIRSGAIEYVVDASPHKQGLFLPGSHIPVVAENRIRETKPDYIIIFPWNLKDEIMAQLSYVKEWGAKFIVPIPEPRIVA